jgi:heme/copper-type cytochrome/quinol oxidase subunit 3
MEPGASAVALEVAERPFGAIDNKKLGMWLFLGSDAMGFTGLLGAYAVLRGAAGDHWQELMKDGKAEFINMEASRNLTFFNTFVLICSSVTMVLALKNLRAGAMGRFKAFLALTMLGGMGFLSMQAIEWTHLIHEGVTAPSCLFGATFFILTGYHGFHVFGGVCLLAWALRRGLKGVYSPQNHVGIEVVGLYWHFVDLVWIILFTVIYLLPGKGGA